MINKIILSMILTVSLIGTTYSIDSFLKAKTSSQGLNVINSNITETEAINRDKLNVSLIKMSIEINSKHKETSFMFSIFFGFIFLLGLFLMKNENGIKTKRKNEDINKL